MAWTTPRTWVAGEVLTAANLNTHVRDNEVYLKGLLDGTGSAADTVTHPGDLAIHGDANFNLALGGLGPTLQLDANDALIYRRTSNTYEWYIGGTVVLTLDANGKLTGAGFYSSGEFNLANGAGTTLSHGLAARPRVVLGFYSTSTGTENSKTKPIAPFLITGYVYISDVSSTQVSVTNGSGAGIAGHIYATL